MSQFYMAVFPDGSLQQIEQEPDQEDMSALDNGDIVAIIRYDSKNGFETAILADIDDKLEITQWNAIQLIASPS